MISIDACELHIEVKPTAHKQCVLLRCNVGFIWAYAFVVPKRRYSHLFRAHTVEQALGSTAAHSARIQQKPASTVQRMHNGAVPMESERIYEKAWAEAKETTTQVLGVDDLLSRKATRTIPVFITSEGRRISVKIRDIKYLLSLYWLSKCKVKQLFRKFETLLMYRYIST